MGMQPGRPRTAGIAAHELVWPRVDGASADTLLPSLCSARRGVPLPPDAVEPWAPDHQPCQNQSRSPVSSLTPPSAFGYRACRRTS